MEQIPLGLLPYDALSLIRGMNRYFRDMASDDMLGIDRMQELVRHFRSLNPAESSWRIDDLSVDDQWGLLCHLAGGEMLFPALSHVNLQVSGYLTAEDGGSVTMDWDMHYPDGIYLLKGDKMTADSLDELHANIRIAIDRLVRDKLQMPSFTDVEFEWALYDLRFITIDPLRRQVFESTATMLTSMTPEMETNLVFVKIEGGVQEIVATLVKRMMNIWY